MCMSLNSMMEDAPSRSSAGRGLSTGQGDLGGISSGKPVFDYGRNFDGSAYSREADVRLTTFL